MHQTTKESTRKSGEIFGTKMSGSWCGVLRTCIMGAESEDGSQKSEEENGNVLYKCPPLILYKGAHQISALCAFHRNGSSRAGPCKIYGDTGKSSYDAVSREIFRKNRKARPRQGKNVPAIKSNAAIVRSKPLCTQAHPLSGPWPALPQGGEPCAVSFFCLWFVRMRKSEHLLKAPKSKARPE